jgi:DNA invertase Pin-like site-specific DNA recombinase
LIHGYARVSTGGQSIHAQVKQLRAARAGKVWRETASGAKTDRIELRRVLDRLDAGDVLMVTRLDRLARSMRDLLNILATIAEKKAGFRSLGDTWADTTTSHGRLMLTVLGGLAEFERDLIRARTSEGRARAVACSCHPMRAAPGIFSHATFLVYCQGRNATARETVNG